MAQAHKAAREGRQEKRDGMSTKIANFPDLAGDIDASVEAVAVIEALSSGGDARITLDPVSGLNRYFSAPYPRKTLAYASSTANDLSRDAFAHLLALQAGGFPEYSEWLEQIRARIRAAYRLGPDIDVVFAPSGTDLEYVALAAVQEKAPGGVHNILLGADEVGSGCIHSAHGRYFASETALGLESEMGREVEGFGPISLADVPVRCGYGLARSSMQISQAIEQELAIALTAGRHALVHVVHGSKTGLILPEIEQIDALQRRYADHATFVIDACQARITSEALHDYLERDAIVFLTGSKFMGGPPFNGFALMRKEAVQNAAKLPQGFARIFRQAEFPQGWAGRETLSDSENLSLALRYEASIFELERFQKLPLTQVERIIAAFSHALEDQVLEPLGLSLVAPHAAGEGAEIAEHPIEMQTLATLDVSSLPGLATFADAQTRHRELALGGLRLGQPVKSVRKDGEWGGTLRIGMSMPQFASFAELDDDALTKRFAADMAQIAEALAADPS